MNKETLIYKGKNSKRGVAIFFVLFVIVILGTLFAQFSFSSRNAQRTVHRFQTSEMARQLAAAAQEEAFKYLYDVTDNPDAIDYEQLNGKGKEILYKIISRSNEINMSEKFDRNSVKGIDLDVSKTKDLAKKILGDNLEISAKARIIDYKTVDVDGKSFYKNEAVGTMEIAVNVKAKDNYKNNFPGSCIMIRHHDYKVVNLLSKKDDRDNFVSNNLLDYVLFLRNGQKEFQDYDGYSLNADVQLEVNACKEDDSVKIGKVNLGSSGSNFTYLNIDEDTSKFIKDVEKKIEIKKVVNNEDIGNYFPQLWKEMVQNITGYKDGDVTITKVNYMRGFTATFYHIKYPITDNYLNSKQPDKIGLRYNISDKKFYQGIKIKPEKNLNTILDSEVRKQYFNYGFFKVDLTNCELNVHYEYDDGWNEDDGDHPLKFSDPKANESVETFKKQDFPCFNDKTVNQDGKTAWKDIINIENIANLIRNNASDAFIAINHDFHYELPDNENNKLENHDYFYDKGFSTPAPPSESNYPYSRFNLFNKRYLNDTNESNTPDELVELGILTEENGKKILNLRGIVQCSKTVELGNVIVRGSGVLIARGIKITGKIEKEKPESVCVLFSRNESIHIKTDEKIQAALIAMKGPDLSGVNMGQEGGVFCESNTLNLEGTLLVDQLNLKKWKRECKHIISYDPNLYPERDVYALNLSRWVTFERVIENE